MHRLTGFTPDDFISTAEFWKDRIHSEDRDRVLNSLARLFQDDEYADEYRWQVSDGSYRDWHDSLRLVRRVDGTVSHVVGMWQDITERKQQDEQRQLLESQIQQTQKLESLGVLAGGIAHDFNNLLMGVLGNSDLAQNELSETSPAAQYVERIQATAVRAADLCKQMLAYSGKGKFVVKAFNMNELIGDMVRLLRVSISKSAVLKYNLSENLLPVEGDVTQIRQIVMNLVTNASEAIGDKSGVITISTGVMEADSDYLAESYLREKLPEGVYAYLEVSDTGCGMDSETVTKIFDPFFSTKFTGRGLGLAAVLGIVRGHQGALKVYSQPRQGTTMKVLLPCTDRAFESLQEDVRPAVSWKGSGTILVVDDEVTVRTVAKKMLEKHGFTVLTANDGREALTVFRSRCDEIRVVLLDMTMPHLGGEETFREMRRIQPNVRVTMMSGYNEQDVTSRFAGKGLAGFIQKPFGQRALLEKMRNALEDGSVAERTILVIDDEEIVRVSVRALLESFGYKVLVADSGRTGVDVLMENVDFVTAVILDFRLPDLSAEDIFQEIRKYSNVPIILISGYLGDQDVENYKQLGYEAVVQKPLPMETLLNLLQGVLEDAP